MGWLHPDEMFGSLLTPIVSVAVAIILFEGSLTLKFSEIAGHGSIVRNLVTVGVVVTWVSAGLAAYYVLGWDPYLAALFGAIVTVSGPTVVMPLLRAVRPSESTASVLRWESILVDPLGAILALLTFNVILAAQTNSGFEGIGKTLAIIVSVGAVAGCVGGYLYGLALRGRVIPDLLRDYSALASVLLVFAGAEWIQAESGFLAVTIMGVWLANMRGVELHDILNFKESITLFLIGGLFIILAAKLDLSDVYDIGYGALIVLAILQFVAGPIRALVSSIGDSFKWREIVFVGWVFPRGIVAAAVSSLFALRLVEINYPGAQNLVPLVFSIIIGTVVIQSVTTKTVARLLRVTEPDRSGVLVVGANRVAQLMAQAIQESGKQVLIADSHWSSIRNARMQGLPVYYGSPVSKYAEDKLDLTGIGSLLAVSRQPGLNELACVRFSAEFGRDRVFVLTNKTEAMHEKHNVSGEVRGRVLFGGEFSIDDLVKQLGRGAAIKSTLLSDEYTFEDYREKHPDNFVLFATDSSGQIRFRVADEKFSPASGWSVAAIVGATPASET